MTQKRTRSASVKEKASKTAISKRIGNLAHEKRIEAGHSIETVADYLGISPLVLTAYEKGARAIPTHHIYGLSNCLNIPPALILKLIASEDFES